MAEPSRAPTAEEWEDQRDTIIHLYISESMSVPRLRLFMRSQYSFHASQKMYRARFRQWGVKKNTLDKRMTVGCQAVAARAPEPRSRITIRPPLQNSLYIPEKLLSLLQSYVKGSSEGLYWPRDYHGSFLNEDVVPSWCSPLMSAAWVLGEGRTQPATVLLGKFLDQCHQQLTRQDPLIFAFVYTSILFFAAKYPGTAAFLLSKLHNAAQSIPDPAVRPLRDLIRVLCQLGPEGIVHHARTTLLAYIEFIQAELAAAYPLVQDMTCDIVMRLVKGRLISSDTAVKHIGQMMSAAEAQGWQRCRYFLQLKMSLSELCLQMGKSGFADARQTAEELMQDQYADCRDMGVEMDYHMLTCKINEAEGCWDEARLSALRAVTTSISHFGKDSDWAANTLIVYRRILERMGEHEEAQRVAQDRDSVVAKLCQFPRQSAANTNTSS